MSAPKLSTNRTLEEADPELFQHLKDEKKRQVMGLELIASENFTSRAVMEANGSCATNKYAEGLPGKRYYGGNQVIDKIETLCQTRALKVFGLDEAAWGVNVQPYSGSTANWAAFLGMIKPHDRIMGLDLPSGGHLTHGYQTDTRKISSTSIFYESMPYQVSPATGLIDYDKLEENAALFRPQLIVVGASAYPRDFDYARMRRIADKHGAWLMCDMAHYAGLVAAKLLDDPFRYCDVVTTTTHKSLRGPRGSMIFYRRGTRVQPLRNGKSRETPYALEDTVNFAVFPSVQGGPHQNTIAAIATAMREALEPDFALYQRRVVANCRALAAALKKRGYALVTDGTDNHVLMWDLRPLGLNGGKMEWLYDLCHITVNKNTVYGDQSALTPGGLRLGSCALTSRDFGEQDFERVAELLHRGIQIGLECVEKAGKLLAAWKEAVKAHPGIEQLSKDTVEFASKFPMPGRDEY